MRITVGEITLEGSTIDEIKSLIGIIEELSKQGKREKAPIDLMEDEETVLRREYAASRGKHHVRLTETVLQGQTPLAFLQAWKAKQGTSEDSLPAIVPDDDGGTVY